MELDNSREDDNTQSDNNEELDNNKEWDNSKSEESVVDAEEPNNSDLDYKHDLFDIAETSKEMCDRFKYCLSFTTFRIHPPPAPIKCLNIYGKWLECLGVYWN